MPVITAVEAFERGDFKVIQELLGKSVLRVIKVLRRLLSLQSEIYWDRPPSPNDFLPRDAAQ